MDICSPRFWDNLVVSPSRSIQDKATRFSRNVGFLLPRDTAPHPKIKELIHTTAKVWRLEKTYCSLRIYSDTRCAKTLFLITTWREITTHKAIPDICASIRISFGRSRGACYKLVFHAGNGWQPLLYLLLILWQQQLVLCPLRSRHKDYPETWLNNKECDAKALPWLNNY
jgi:hypothetical protein